VGTTSNPETRRFIQVRIEDVVAAEHAAEPGSPAETSHALKL
jgi:hypothetical protein